VVKKERKQKESVMIKIKSMSGNVLYEDKKATTIKQAVENAVDSDANLSSADLRYADLSYAEGLNKKLCTPLCILEEQIGKIRAYKLVNKNYEGPYQGGIVYKVGETHSVKDANTDDTIQCAKGINLATLSWCITEWKKGYHILIAEFTQKDIACIPIASDGKFRVHKCKIIGEKDLKELNLK